MSQRWGIVCNPVHASAAKRLAHLTGILASLGIPWDTAFTTPVHTGQAQAAAFVRAGVRVVAVIGGDGTMSACAHALAGSPSLLFPVANGQANLCARHLRIAGLSAQRVRRADLAAGDRGDDHAVTRIDVGRVVLEQSGHAWETSFLTMAGMGNDARSIMRRGRNSRAWGGWLSYLAAGVPLLSAPLFDARLHSEPSAPLGDAHRAPGTKNSPNRAAGRLRAWSVLVGIAPGLPRPLRVFPDDPGRLSGLVCAPGGSPASVGRRAADWSAIAAHSLGARQPRSITRWSAARIVVTPDHPQPVQVDGEVYPGIERARVSILPSALRVCV